MNVETSIVIPAYNMHGHGGKFLDFSLNKIFNQTYKNYEVVVSDHSKPEEIEVENVCRYWRNKKGMLLRHIRNEYKRGSSSANVNVAIKNATGSIVKILFQDDFLYNNDALEKTIKSFNDNLNKNWLVSACEHSKDGINMYRSFYPKYHSDIHLGVNSISSPSVLSFKRAANNQFFDEQLIWLMDVEYYKRLYTKIGEPIILNEITIVNRTWDMQVSNTVSENIKQKEMAYVKGIYGH